MKILHIIHSLDPKLGGPAETVRQLSREFNGSGHDVQIATMDGPECDWLHDAFLKTHALGPRWIGYGYTPRLVPWLKQHCAEFDLVIVNGLWNFSSLSCWLAVRDRIPYCIFPHGMLDPWFGKRYPLKHLKKLLYWFLFERRNLKRASRVIFTCAQEKKLALTAFPKMELHPEVISYGTAGPPDEPHIQMEAWKKRFPETLDKRVLLYLGRIHEKKGCDLLLTAFRNILANRPNSSDIVLVMAGPNDSEYAVRMAQLGIDLGISKQILWVGMLQGNEKWGALRSAEAFILPSHQENFGIAVAESLGCSTPVLISDQVNIWSEINEARAGYVEKDDLQGTERLIQRWLETPAPEWEQMRKNALRCFYDHFQMEHVAKSLMNVLDAVVAEHQNKKA